MLLNLYIKEPRQPAQACVIWMHGLGADAQDMAGLAKQLPLTVSVRHVCLDAPVRPVTLNNGMPMQAWYDIIGLSLTDREDSVGVKQSVESIQQAIDSQLAEGFKAQQIFLAGFSQGGAMALYAGLNITQELGGIIALSAYLPLASTCAFGLNCLTPMFLAGGVYDPIILPAWSKLCVDTLRNKGFEQVSWHEYPMEHSICAEEAMDLAQWINLQVESIAHRLGGIE